MSKHLKIVTIDGPSGVGKSSISRKLAQKLQYTYLDTGAMYRAVALACFKKGIKIEDHAQISKILPVLEIQLYPPDQPSSDIKVCLNREDVSSAIRTPELGMLASQVSAIPSVRKFLTAIQQRMGEKELLVAEGRDTGTVVFPGAAWKFYLDATPEERCRRRVEQLRSMGTDIVDPNGLLEQIKKRDQADSKRSIAPLVKAVDAVYIDSSDMDIASVIKVMMDHITA